MEATEDLAERLMSQYEDRIPLKRICDEILVVLREGGLRTGDSVPSDLVAEVEQRLAVLSRGTPRTRPNAFALPVFSLTTLTSPG